MKLKLPDDGFDPTWIVHRNWLRNADINWIPLSVRAVARCFTPEPDGWTPYELGDEPVLAFAPAAYPDGMAFGVVYLLADGDICGRTDPATATETEYCTPPKTCRTSESAPPTTSSCCEARIAIRETRNDLPPLARCRVARCFAAWPPGQRALGFGAGACGSCGRLVVGGWRVGVGCGFDRSGRFDLVGTVPPPIPRSQAWSGRAA